MISEQAANKTRLIFADVRPQQFCEHLDTRDRDDKRRSTSSRWSYSVNNYSQQRNSKEGKVHRYNLFTKPTKGSEPDINPSLVYERADSKLLRWSSNRS